MYGTTLAQRHDIAVKLWLAGHLRSCNQTVGLEGCSFIDVEKHQSGPDWDRAEVVLLKRWSPSGVPQHFYRAFAAFQHITQRFNQLNNINKNQNEQNNTRRFLQHEYYKLAYLQRQRELNL